MKHFPFVHKQAFFFPPSSLQSSMLWSCSVSKISTELCRGCLTWSQIKSKKSTQSTFAPARLISYWSRRCFWGKTVNSFLVFVLCLAHRSVLPSSSPRWQKNQIDIKMYLSGVVQVRLCFPPLRFQAPVFLWGRSIKDFLFRNGAVT